MKAACAALCISLAASVPAVGQEVSYSGLYRDRDGTCDASLVGKPGGAVKITPSEIVAPRGRCVFTSRTRVSRMPAELRDAACAPASGGQKINERFFIFADPRGVTVVSKSWGTWALAKCP